MGFTGFDIGDFAALVAVAGSAIGLWVALNGRLIKVETTVAAHEKRMDAELVNTNRRFQEQGERLEKALNSIDMKLGKIEDKLDHKADKEGH